MQKYALIVAGGWGLRMGSPVPKQFLLLNGTPVLALTLKRFKLAAPEIHLVVALAESLMAEWELLCKRYSVVSHILVAGGGTRTETVRNALQTIPDQAVVAIHDAVRPLVSPELIRKSFESAIQYGNAVPAVSMKESARIIKDSSLNEPVDRAGIKIIQTPQCFLASQIKRAYSELPISESLTDDATVLERMGEKIHLIEGEEFNIKITTPFDLALSESLIKEGLIKI